MRTYASDRSPILLLLDWLTLLVALNVMYEGTSHAATSSATMIKQLQQLKPTQPAANVVLPYLVVPVEAGRYAFPSVDVGGGSVARHFEIL